MKPSEYFRRQMGACFWFEDDDALIREAIHKIGDDNCMFETDFPHPTRVYPNPVERALETFKDEGDDFKRKIFGGNAVRIYNLPVQYLELPDQSLRRRRSGVIVASPGAIPMSRSASHARQ